MFFKKKPNEDQMEITALTAAVGFFDQGETVFSDGVSDLIKYVVTEIYSSQGLKPDPKQLHATYTAAHALLAEETLVKEYSELRKRNPGAPISREYSRRIKEICADFVEFAMNQGQ